MKNACKPKATNVIIAQYEKGLRIGSGHSIIVLIEFFPYGTSMTIETIVFTVSFIEFVHIFWIHEVFSRPVM